MRTIPQIAPEEDAVVTGGPLMATIDWRAVTPGSYVGGGGNLVDSNGVAWNANHGAQTDVVASAGGVLIGGTSTSPVDSAGVSIALQDLIEGLGWIYEWGRELEVISVVDQIQYTGNFDYAYFSTNPAEATGHSIEFGFNRFTGGSGRRIDTTNPSEVIVYYPTVETEATVAKRFVGADLGIRWKNSADEAVGTFRDGSLGNWDSAGTVENWSTVRRLANGGEIYPGPATSYLQYGAAVVANGGTCTMRLLKTTLRYFGEVAP